ncbi:hypothetical protein [Thalassotalea ganghwensis]
MNEQQSLWHEQQQTSPEFAELCCALYERELKLLADLKIDSAKSLQGRMKSLSYYVKRTANFMCQAQTPLTLDVQNATWSAKQASQLPLVGQEREAVNQWYRQIDLMPGLVVPIATSSHIVLDCVDRVDHEKQRFRTNSHGWYELSERAEDDIAYRLLKPNKRVMTAACAGHAWLNNHKINPVIPSLRELLLSCTINWRNFKRPLPFN